MIEQALYGSRVRGCILGGAVGDALGYPVEFRSLAEIRSQHKDGVRTFPEPIGQITDDTQMTLFTMEGLIRAGVRTDRGIGFTLSLVDHAYKRWYDTQTLRAPSGERDGWLIGEQWLYAIRAPGNTCLNSLSAKRGSVMGEQAENNSKGCGGVMRSAPFGLIRNDKEEWAFDAAATCAGYTHGHLTGKVASGALAVLVRALIAGQSLSRAVDHTVEVVEKRDDNGETIRALRLAVDLAQSGSPSSEQLEEVGGGWIAEEALAIAVYAALSHSEPEEFLDALSLAVTHSGDSDSTGAICGNILGALHGEAAVPAELIFCLEGRSSILELTDDFIFEFTQATRLHGEYGPSTGWTERYPGW